MVMSSVTCHIAVSLDGLAAGPNQSLEKQQQAPSGGHTEQGPVGSGRPGRRREAGLRVASHRAVPIAASVAALVAGATGRGRQELYDGWRPPLTPE
jgi:hypothetical protein